MIMKYSVRYFVVDRSDRNYEKESTIDANSREDIIKQLKRLNRGCHIHSVRAEEIVEDEVYTPTQRERCEYCNTPLNDGGTCPVCDDGEEDYGDLNESSRGVVTPQEFWELVCSAEDTKVREILTKGRAPAELYTAFGRKHSYIMGAIRNGNWTTARLLLTFGVKFAPYEAEELAERLITLNNG